MRVLRACVTVAIAFALTGGPTIAAAMTKAAAAHRACANASHRCHESTFSCTCCVDPDSSSEQTPALPSSERGASKTAAAHGLVALTIAVFAEAPLARPLSTPSSHRAGPPRSLSILNVTLLL